MSEEWNNLRLFSFYKERAEIHLVQRGQLDQLYPFTFYTMLYQDGKVYWTWDGWSSSFKEGSFSLGLGGVIPPVFLRISAE